MKKKNKRKDSELGPVYNVQPGYTTGLYDNAYGRSDRYHVGYTAYFFFFLSFNRRIASYKVDKVEWVDSADGSVVWMIIGVVSIRGLSYGP